MFSLSSLYSQHAARSLEKQLALQAVTGDYRFEFDLHAGTLRFGDELTFPMQVLGTVSRQSNTWRWAWAAPQQVPDALLQAAHQLQKLGNVRGITELCTAGFDIVSESGRAGSLPGLPQQPGLYGQPTPPLDGHLLAMLATGICQADAYYGADYGPGIAYVLLPVVPGVDVHWAQQPAQLADVFARVVALPYALEARAAFVAYLTQKGYALETDGRQWLRGVKGGRWLMASFDEGGQLTALQPDHSEPA